MLRFAKPPLFFAFHSSPIKSCRLHEGRIRQAAAWTDKIGIQPGLRSFWRVFSGVANGRTTEGLRMLSAQPLYEEKTMRKQGERS